MKIELIRQHSNLMNTQQKNIFIHFSKTLMLVFFWRQKNVSLNSTMRETTCSFILIMLIYKTDQKQVINPDIYNSIQTKTEIFTCSYAITLKQSMTHRTRNLSWWQMVWMVLLLVVISFKVLVSLKSKILSLLTSTGRPIFIKSCSVWVPSSLLQCCKLRMIFQNNQIKSFIHHEISG